MKRTLILLVMTSVMLVFAGPALAFDKVGTTAAQFLQIGVGGRLPGMGGAGVAFIDGPEALYWNPARIVAGRRFALSLYYADWIADLRHQFIGVTVPLSRFGTVGFHVISLGGGEFEQTTLSFPEGSGVMVEYRDIALGISYARRLTDRFSVGGTAKYIHQKLFHETATAPALDLGTHLKTDLPGFSIGMAMTNLGGEMTLEGRDLLAEVEEGPQTEYQVSSWPLPLTFQVGIAWRLWGSQDAVWHNDDYGGVLVLDGRHINEGLTRWRTGFEYNFRHILFLRLGRVFGHHTEKWSFGNGLRIPVGSYLVEAHFAFADLGDLQGVQRISLQISGR